MVINNNFIVVSFVLFIACFLTYIILETIRLVANSFKWHAKTLLHVLLYHKIALFSLNPIK
ncbi:hypothetical protein EPC82_02780 [Helicobacter pylori]|nr:hypothetical protein EPC82_02780 [Helicobacter pylori]